MSTHVTFVYPPELLQRPVIYELGKQFGLVTNIRKANIADAHGWVVLELVGAPLAIQAALLWVREQGLSVEVIEAADSSFIAPSAVRT
jgi:L-aspartate semialdehyde sulfurtransferase ferredoxin